MKEIIKTDNELCVGCNRCVRECPMEMANITYQDENGNIKVSIDYEKCISCGRCVSACKHKARLFYDDTASFFGDLAAGVPISLIAAPSIRTNLPDYKRLFTYLRSVGVKKIYDVSLGADICVWAHIRHIEKTGSAQLITQPCPSIVTYCEVYRPDLLEYLSPVHSPMACIAIYMKEYEGVTDRIAALSPCIAKSDEFEATGLAQYNVTFPKLIEYMENNGITLPDEETGFDHYRSGIGSLFPMPGGLKENIEFYMGKDVHVSRAEGFSVFEKLNVYATTKAEILPEIFDVVNCVEGCNIGSACLLDKNVFEISHEMKNSRDTALDSRDTEYFRSVFKEYDDRFSLSRFMREYKSANLSYPVITDDDIEKAYALMGKDNFDKKNVNCSACGSETCYQMARKIALGVNIPVNCIVKSMEDAKKEHAENLRYHDTIATMEKMREADERIRQMMRDIERRDVLLVTVSRVADILLATDDEESMEASIVKSLELIGLAVDVDHVQIWKNEVINDELHYVNTYHWRSELGSRIESVPLGLQFPYSKAPGWENIFMRGDHINSPYSKLPQIQQDFLAGYEIKAIAMIPLFLHDHFWGFFDLTDCHQERYFLDDEINILRSASLMMANALLRDEAMSNIRAAIAEAQAANHAKSAFLSNMSHEIRTPMNAILGITEIQFQNDNLEPDIKEAFDKIYNSGDMLLGIINDILDLSKIEAGKLELIIDNYEVASLINDAAQLNVMRIGSKPIRFDIEVDELLPCVMKGDELRVKQILNNLLSNAFKYTQEGTVKLSVFPEKGADPDGNDTILTFRVSDTGQGMTEEQIDRLFDEYARFNLQANRTAEGTGLGMSITQNLVRMMNGEISVKSEPGKGSEFTVRIPQETGGKEVLGRDLAENLRQFRVSSREQMKRVQITREQMPYGSVLIVDDVETNIYVAKGLLSPYSLKVDSADSGYAAIEKIKAGCVYDIVFMDHMMPIMDGIEATVIIRNMGYKGCIVALTANALAGQAELFMENGFDDFISKPIDLRQLNTVLNKYIRDAAHNGARGSTPRDAAAHSVAHSAAHDATLSDARAGAFDDVHDAALTDARAGALTDARAGAIDSVHDSAPRDDTVAPAATPPGVQQHVSKRTSIDLNPRFAEIFSRDANKAIKMLDTLSEKQGEFSDENMRDYIITVHGMKSALANIGLMELSDIALKLELAGRNEDTAAISSGTPEFIRQLRELVEELAPKNDTADGALTDGALTDENRSYLVGKLLEIKAECENYNNKDAKTLLSELRGRAWPQPMSDLLNTIAEHLLHSDFDEIISAVDAFLDGN